LSTSTISSAPSQSLTDMKDYWTLRCQY